MKNLKTINDSELLKINGGGSPWPWIPVIYDAAKGIWKGAKEATSDFKPRGI